MADHPDTTSRSRPIAVAVDARDPEALAAFWCAALGSTVVRRWTDAHGAPYDHPWVVMADPEGNAFCVLPAR